MTPSILLVSNDPSAAQSFMMALGSVTREGPTPQLRTVSNGDEALALATTETPPTLVIVDLILPRPSISGLALLNRLREIRPKIKRILVTDHAYLEDLLEGFADLLVTRATVAWGEGFTDELARRVIPLISVKQNSGSVSVNDVLLGDKYRLVEELGRGGMGIVYRAEDTFIQRKVAIKLLEVPTTVSPELLQRRMRREVMIAGRMVHPNLVTVYDAGFEHENLYLVMELIKGETLAEHLQRLDKPLPHGEALRITDGILSALTYAHAIGVVHCDLKPENVLLARNGQVKVTDFGIARLFSQAPEEDDENPDLSPMFSDLTLEGAVPGTLAYMAPEQMIGERIDHRADLYSVGVLLFEMLHGVKISTFGSPLKRAAIQLPPVEGDPYLTTVLERAMALERDERWESAEDFSHALRNTDQPSWWRRFLPWGATT